MPFVADKTVLGDRFEDLDDPLSSDRRASAQAAQGEALRPSLLCPLDEFGVPGSERRKIERLQEIKRARDDDAVGAALDELVVVARDAQQNLMPATIAAVRANASMGEIVEALVPVFGRYTERPVF